MQPSIQASAAPLPPLPPPQTSPGGGGNDAPPGFLASIMSGVAPVKNAVDQIRAACAQVANSGVPGSEQICGQIVALAMSLLPMAAQNAVQGAGPAPVGPIPGGSPTGPGGIAPGPPPPSGPLPIGAQ